MTYDLYPLILANGFLVLLSIYFGIFVYPYRGLSEETRRRPRSFISNAFFREFWYFVMEPLKRKLILWEVMPNTITSWGLGFSVAASFIFAFGHFGLGGWMVLLASTCDVYDGMLARAKNITNKSGAFYDSTMDRIGEAAIFGGLLWFFRNEAVWFLVILVAHAASQIVSYARARAEGLGFDKGGSRGFFQRAERMIVLTFGTVLSPVLDMVYPGTAYLTKLAIVIVFIGSLQTAFARSIGIYREIRASEK